MADLPLLASLCHIFCRLHREMENTYNVLDKLLEEASETDLEDPIAWKRIAFNVYQSLTRKIQ